MRAPPNLLGRILQTLRPGPEDERLALSRQVHVQLPVAISGRTVIIEADRPE
jgi:hypothetical protein